MFGRGRRDTSRQADAHASDSGGQPGEVSRSSADEAQLFAMLPTLHKLAARHGVPTSVLIANPAAYVKTNEKFVTNCSVALDAARLAASRRGMTLESFLDSSDPKSSRPDSKRIPQVEDGGSTHARVPKNLWPITRAQADFIIQHWPPAVFGPEVRVFAKRADGSIEIHVSDFGHTSASQRYYLVTADGRWAKLDLF